MKHNNPTCGFAAGFGALLALAAGAASADVTTEQKMRVEGVGMMAVGNMSGTTKTAISGNRSRTDSDLQLDSKFVRFLARSAVGPTADIVLIDSDKMYHLNINRKEYTEMSFPDFRARMQNAMQGRGAGEETRQQPSAIDQSTSDTFEIPAGFKKVEQKGAT